MSFRENSKLEPPSWCNSSVQQFGQRNRSKIPRFRHVLKARTIDCMSIRRRSDWFHLRVRSLWPMPIVILGTLISILGTLYTTCICSTLTTCSCSSPNYVMSIGGLVLAVAFTYVFVFLSAQIHESPQVVRSAA